MTGRQLIPLQPKPSASDRSDDGADPQPSRVRKTRSVLLVACDTCRRLKTKCDGERPACRKCRSKGHECTYELPQDALSRTSARKEIASQLQRENLELRQLFHDLARRPEPEAYEIFQRLRSAGDPIALAHSIRQAELLLPPALPDERPEVAALQQLEFDALGRSPIKVPAKPWTNVAGDGIVSELITSWFKWDGAFLYPFIDREAFTQDMRAGDPENAKYCSAFLVNAICALRSYFSDTVDKARRLSGQDIRERFFADAQKQYDRELPTIPTIQGLWIMFALASIKGQDRNGSLNRFAAYGMLKRCGATQLFFSLSDSNPEDVVRKREISTLVWTFFNFECLTALNFRGTDVIPLPKIPCLFPETPEGSQTNLDLFDQEFSPSSPQPPFVRGAVNAFCRVAILLRRVFEFEGDRGDAEEVDLDNPGDTKTRMDILVELQTLHNTLPLALRSDHNFTPQTCFLRVAMNTVAHAILRPLHPDIVLDEADGTTVRAARLKHCSIDMDVMEQYMATWGEEEFSSMVFVAPLNAGTVLLPLLLDATGGAAAQQLFPRICRIMRAVATRMPVARYVMRGWQAALFTRKIEIPGPAQPYFQNLGSDHEDLKDLPTSLVIAHVPKLDNVLTVDWDDGELGYLLRKWGL